MTSSVPFGISFPKSVALCYRIRIAAVAGHHRERSLEEAARCITHEMQGFSMDSQRLSALINGIGLAQIQKRDHRLEV